MHRYQNCQNWQWIVLKNCQHEEGGCQNPRKLQRFLCQNKSQVTLWKIPTCMSFFFALCRHKVTKILTCCIVFQFESSSSVYIIRMKINKEVVAWGYLARWGGMTIFSNYWRCHWTPIIHSQFIIAETIIPILFTVFIMVKT